MAERSTFSMSRATPLRAKRSVASAWLTSRPRIRSSTRPAFCAEVRMYFAVACASMAIYAPARGAGRRRRRDLRRLVRLRRVSLEEARRRELAELVPDHVLGDIDRDE